MSDSYRATDVRALVERIEKIIESEKYGDSLATAVKCVAEVMNLPRAAEGIHLKGITAEDTEDIRLHLGAYETVRWDTPGQTVTGEYYGTRTFGWRYKTTHGWVMPNTWDGGTFFSLPDGLREKLRGVRHGTKVTITYVGREGGKKAFTVEPAVSS